MSRADRARAVMAEIKAKMTLVKPEEVERPNRTSKGFKSPSSRPQPPQRGGSATAYKAKLESGNLDKFSTKDTMYFFRDTAQENGCKYIIANPQKDMHQYKLLLERGYTIEDILSMIEFLFTSEQDYLEKSKLSPNVLVSAWCNTIYSDTQLWLNDEYLPKNKKKHQNREWTQKVDDGEVAKVDDWGF